MTRDQRENLIITAALVVVVLLIAAIVKGVWLYREYECGLRTNDTAVVSTDWGPLQGCYLTLDDGTTVKDDNYWVDGR